MRITYIMLNHVLCKVSRLELQSHLFLVQTRQSCLIVQDKVYKQENVDVICTEDDKSNNNNLKLMFRLNGMEKNQL
ncbi:hypothetical protein GCM10023150_21970 [Kangiella taiwanensis]|uniref:Uncharacterized protein n=1 Tax=Kangiella taiwanensis TaxID=1079179 RepID=A0ABP8I855_9GAMM